LILSLPFSASFAAALLGELHLDLDLAGPPFFVVVLTSLGFFFFLAVVATCAGVRGLGRSFVRNLEGHSPPGQLGLEGVGGDAEDLRGLQVVRRDIRVVTAYHEDATILEGGRATPRAARQGANSGWAEGVGLAVEDLGAGRLSDVVRSAGDHHAAAGQGGSRRSVARCSIDPTAVNLPLAGSKTSALFFVLDPSYPPAIKTRPSGSATTAAPSRLMLKFGPGVNCPVAGLKNSVVSRLAHVVAAGDQNPPIGKESPWAS